MSSFNNQRGFAPFKKSQPAVAETTNHRPGHSQMGFTLIELLLATTFFSFVLLLTSSGFIQVFRIYQSGVIAKNAQNTTRTIFETMGRDAREASVFSPTVTAPSGNGECFSIGNHWYYLNTVEHELRRTDPNTAQSNCEAGQLMHESNLNVYAFVPTLVKGKDTPGGPYRSVLIDMLIGVTDDDIGDLIDDSGLPIDTKCQTNPTALRLCSVIRLKTSVSLRGGGA